MRKTTKRLLPLLATVLLTFVTAITMAQSAIIKGIVKDASGNPLSGATVTVEPKNIGTTTDASGNYSFKVPAGSYRLVISFVGQATERMAITVKAGETVEKNIGLVTTGDAETVHVVGSRSTKPRSIISTPVPVDIISAKEMKQFPQTDITQMLAYAIPSFQSNKQSVTDGTDAIDPATLRGLGPDQVLVLVNGKRRHNTALVNINGSPGRGSVGTDMNAIPAAAIDHIEVLRDGAAAQYGSDAIAGVINIVLKQKFKGSSFSTTLGGNVTSMPFTPYYSGQATNKHINDGFTRQIEFSAGTYAKSGAFVNISGQFLGRNQTNRSGEANDPMTYLGTSGTGFPGAPSGAVPSTVTTGVYRQWLMDQDKAIQVQRGYNRQNMIVGQASNLNYTMFVNAGLPLWKGFQAYLTTGIGYRSGQSEGNFRTPNAIAQQPQGTTLNTFSGNYDYYADGFLPQILSVVRDYSVLGGIKGKIGNWSLDLSNTWGTNSFDYAVSNSGNATAAPATNPQTSFYAGKQAFFQNTTDLDINRSFDFGNKNSLNVAFGGEARHEIYQIKAGEDASWNTGTLASDSTTVPAYTGGTSYRLGATTAPGAQVFPGFRPSNALNVSRNVYGGYLDLEATFGKLLLGAAGRYESYDETSANITYNGTGLKFTGRYEISPKFSIRGSYGTGFRAPSLHQRYFNNISTQFSAGIAQNTLTANNQDPIVRTAFGVNELKPETSKDYTFGFASTFGKGWTLTVDGYLIDITNRIVLSSAFNASSNPLVKTIFTTYNVTNAQSVQFWSNAINTETKGIDFVLSKRHRITSKASLMTSLAANFNRNDVVGSIHTNPTIDQAGNNPSSTDATQNPANDFKNVLFDRQQRARIEKGAPSSKINLTGIYSTPKWDVLLRFVYFGKVTELNSATNDPTTKQSATNYWYDSDPRGDQTFAAKITTDLVITYKPAIGVGISIGANNLFDVYPDALFQDPRNSYASVYANPQNPATGFPNGNVANAGPKTTVGYNSSRDQSNRGHLLFSPNQFGYNGRYVFGRVTLDLGLLTKKH